MSGLTPPTSTSVTVSRDGIKKMRLPLPSKLCPTHVLDPSGTKTFVCIFVTLFLHFSYSPDHGIKAAFFCPTMMNKKRQVM